MWYVVLGGLVGFALVLAGLRLLTSRGARLARELIATRHADLEAIVQSGRAPPRWGLNRWLRAGLLPALARRVAVRRLEGLLAYTRQTRLIEDEQCRAAATARLDELLRSWRRRSPPEIAAGD